MTTELWTPRGSVLLGVERAGNNNETGGFIELCKFEFRDPVTGRSQPCVIPRTEDMSRAEVEDQAAQGYENFLIECRHKGKVESMTPEERKEIGKSLKDFKESAFRRREANGKLYYAGLE